ncbi:hypothetical protein DFH06DRAFT_1336380 [Mycena polygramma]|nr:hypothetical protein DFH06DRAFT_1336380 [Mycena polygramma]
MRSLWWLLLVHVLLAAAGQTNHTIDDANSQVDYLPSGFVGMACDGCNDAGAMEEWALDPTKLENGTFSAFLPPGLSSKGDTAMEFSFTVQYNVSAYANSSLSNSFHTFKMGVTGQVLFDYAVYTSDDGDPAGSSQVSSSTAAPQKTSSSVAKNTAPVAAIAGGVVGAVALIGILFLSLFIVRRARRNNVRGRDTPAMEESGPASTDAFFTATSRGQEPLSAEQFRILQQQVQRLEQRVEGSGSASSDTTSLGRSLSTMKREQTRALQDSGQGRHITDTLVHTDSGLRLTAGRGADEGVVHELPPTYVAD